MTKISTLHFNGLLPAEAERLSMLAEEAGEIVQAVGKVLRHGYESRHPDGGPSNRETLRREIDDLRAVVIAMEIERDIAPSNNGVVKAWQKKLRFSHHQTERKP